MRRKVGTIVAMETEKGEIYLANDGAITDNIKYAKAYRASKACLSTICAQAKAQFAPFVMKVSTIESWRDE